MKRDTNAYFVICSRIQATLGADFKMARSCRVNLSFRLSPVLRKRSIILLDIITERYTQQTSVYLKPITPILQVAFHTVAVCMLIENTRKAISA